CTLTLLFGSPHDFVFFIIFLQQASVLYPSYAKEKGFLYFVDDEFELYFKVGQLILSEKQEANEKRIALDEITENFNHANVSHTALEEVRKAKEAAEHERLIGILNFLYAIFLCKKQLSTICISDDRGIFQTDQISMAPIDPHNI
ncbi:hypothetical protein ACJX0J_024869, partial [Zea mays]